MVLGRSWLGRGGFDITLDNKTALRGLGGF
jgi:hypothetical protein